MRHRKHNHENILNNYIYNFYSLLSNASLPEMNPLLGLGDDSVEDDFQRMLSDWESHIDTLQVKV